MATAAPTALELSELGTGLHVIGGQNDAVGLSFRERAEAAARRHCQRPCTRRRSLIVVTVSAIKLAGFTDRIIVLQHLANLAGSLCARLLVPRPCEALSASHNSDPLHPLGLHLSCNVTWARYMRLTMIGDGTNALVCPDCNDQNDKMAHFFSTTNGFDASSTRAGKQLAAAMRHIGPSRCPK